MKKSLFVEGVCLAFIVLFVYAAVNKLMDYQKFKVQLEQSPLLNSFAGWVAWFIPACEILISCMLAFTRTRLAGMYACFSLMILFEAYIFTVTRFSEHVPCACGGILGKLGWSAHFIFNGCWVAAALAGVLFYPDRTRQHLLQ